jgi:trypsin
MATVEPSVGTYAIVTGWGRLTQGGQYPDQLQAADVFVTTRGACVSHYASYGVITDNMFCAGGLGVGKGPCQGDEGSALLYDGELIGIVSWGVGCALVDYPRVYANIATLRSFVTEQTGVN